jgi:hypothetical protein
MIYFSNSFLWKSICEYLSKKGQITKTFAAGEDAVSYLDGLADALQTCCASLSFIRAGRPIRLAGDWLLMLICS